MQSVNTIWCYYRVKINHITPLAQRHERQAHNLEVTGSKPVGGNFSDHEDNNLMITINRCGAAASAQGS